MFHRLERNDARTVSTDISMISEMQHAPWRWSAHFLSRILGGDGGLREYAVMRGCYRSGDVSLTARKRSQSQNRGRRWGLRQKYDNCQDDCSLLLVIVFVRYIEASNGKFELDLMPTFESLIDSQTARSERGPCRNFSRGSHFHVVANVAQKR